MGGLGKKVKGILGDLANKGGGTGPSKGMYAGTIMDASLTPITGRRLRKQRNSTQAQEYLGG